MAPLGQARTHSAQAHPAGSSPIMALTSGNRQPLREAASWAVVALIGAAAFSHFETLKTGAEQLLGLPTPSDIDARTAAQSAQLESPTPQQQASSSIVELKAGRNGHFNAEAEVNGRSVKRRLNVCPSMTSMAIYA